MRRLVVYMSPQGEILVTKRAVFLAMFESADR